MHALVEGSLRDVLLADIRHASEYTRIVIDRMYVRVARRCRAQYKRVCRDESNAARYLPVSMIASAGVDTEALTGEANIKVTVEDRR